MRKYLSPSRSPEDIVSGMECGAVDGKTARCQPREVAARVEERTYTVAMMSQFRMIDRP